MQSVVNAKLVSRNAKIGQYLNLASLAIILVGFFITLRAQTYIAYSYIAIFVGLVMFMIGTYFTNRWGRTPPAHEVLDKNLKGLGREFIVYHHVTPASHLLVSPAGIWALLPYYQSGIISYEKKRWRAKGGGFMQAYLRFFGPESLGRPDLEANSEIQAIQRHLTRIMPEGTSLPEVNAVLIFVNPRVEIHPNDSPQPALLSKDLKEFLRQKAKEKPISQSVVELIQNALPPPENE